MKINLIFFISEFNLGGAGNSIFKLCKNLPKNKFKVSVICLNKCYYKNLLNKNGIKVFEIKSSKTILAMNKIKNLTQNLIHKKFKNIFISNIYYSNVLSILFLRNLSMKIILIERTPHQELSIYYGFLDFIKKNLLKFLIRITFYRADLCLSNSKFISREYNKAYKLNFKTIFPPSFSGRIFHNKNMGKDKIYFGTVCRLGKEKNLSKLFIMLSKFKKKIFFEIIGDGPERENLIKLRDKLGLKKVIKFSGSVHPTKVYKYFKKFHYYINSSDFEGFPNSVVEALSHGVPVIASQSYGGINEILPNKNFGYIYKNDEEFVSIISKIVSNNFKKKIVRSKLRNHLIKFDEKKNYQKYRNIFVSI